MKATYAAVTYDTDGWQIEATNGRRWRDEQFSPEKVEARRRAIQERGRTM